MIPLPLTPSHEVRGRVRERGTGSYQVKFQPPSMRWKASSWEQMPSNRLI